MLFQVLVLTIVVSHAATQISVPSESDPGQQIIRVGSTYYTPLYAVNSAHAVQAAESAALGILQNPPIDFNQAPSGQQSYTFEQPKGGYRYPVPTQPTTPPPKSGYRYPVPTKPTRPPPLAEQNPVEEEDKYATDTPIGATPDRVAEYPTTPYPVGLETDQEIESVGITPEPPRPRPVNDRPTFEFPDVSDCPPDTPDSWPCGYRNSIPGIEGVDYPIYASIPKTSFQCNDFPHSGYFADVESRCQSFHVCLRRDSKPPKKWSFLCPNGTVFSQQEFVCSWWNEAPDCNESPSYYSLNNELNWDEITERTMLKMQTVRVRPTLPPITVRLRDDVIGANLVQVQRSKAYVTGKSNSRSQTLIKLDQARSDSEAYEDKSIPAEGFIVNRRPTSSPNRLNTQTDSSPAALPPRTRPATTLLPRRTTTELPQTDNYDYADFDSMTTSTKPPSRKVYGPPNYVPPEPTNPPQSTGTPFDLFDEELTAPTDSFDFNGKTTASIQTTTTGVASSTTPKSKLNYSTLNKSGNKSNFKSEDSAAIAQILDSSNILDTIPDGIELSGFSKLGTQSQIFNSNIRDLLKSKGRVQEVRPEFVEIVSGNGSDVTGVEPVRAFLSSQGDLKDKQTLEIDQFGTETPNQTPVPEVENSLPRDSLYKVDGQAILKAMPIPGQQQSQVQPAPQSQFQTQPAPQSQFQTLIPQFFPTFQVRQHPVPLFQPQPQFFHQAPQMQPQFVNQYPLPVQNLPQQPQPGSQPQQPQLQQLQPPPQSQPQPAQQPQQQNQPQLMNQYLPPAQNPSQPPQPQPTPPAQQLVPQFAQFVLQPPQLQHQIFPQFGQLLQPVQRQVLQPYVPPPSPPTIQQDSYQQEPPVSHSEYSPEPHAEEPSSDEPSDFSPDYSSAGVESYPTKSGPSYSSQSTPTHSESYSSQSGPSYPSQYTPTHTTYSSPTFYSPSSPPKQKNSGYFGPIKNFIKTTFGSSKPQFPSRSPLFSTSASSRPAYYPSIYSSNPQYKSQYFPSSSSSSSQYSSEADFGDQYTDQSVARPVVVAPSAAPASNGPEVVPAVGIYLKTIVSGGRNSGVISSALASTAQHQTNPEATQEFSESTNSFRVSQPLQTYNQHNIPEASLQIFLPCQAGPNKVCPNGLRTTLLPQQQLVPAQGYNTINYPAASYQAQPLTRFTPVSNNGQGYSNGVKTAKLLVAIPTQATPKYNPVQYPVASYQPQTWTKITPASNNGQGYTNGVNAAKLLVAIPTQATPHYNSGDYATNQHVAGTQTQGYYQHQNQVHGSVSHYDRTKQLLSQRGQATHYNGNKVTTNNFVQPATALPQVATHRGNVPVHNAATKQQQEQQVAYGFKPNAK